MPTSFGAIEERHTHRTTLSKDGQTWWGCGVASPGDLSVQYQRPRSA